MDILSKKKYLFLGILIFTYLAFPPAFYFYTQYQKMYADYQKTKMLLNKSSEVLGETSNQETIDKVSKLIELPSETPSIEKITDKSIFQDQPFFNSARVGDKILVYNNARKIIIYREAVNKIVDVGAINIEENLSSTPIPAASTAPHEDNF